MQFEIQISGDKFYETSDYIKKSCRISTDR